MFKTFAGAVMGAILCVAVSAALAVGYPPLAGSDPQLIDGTWVLGVAGGVNSSYQYGISAAGSNQAGATQLPSGIKLMEVDTVASSTGVAVPPCLQGTEFSLYNNGANTLTVYPSATNNPITTAQDTINNTTSITVSSHAAEGFFCAKNGNWAAH